MVGMLTSHLPDLVGQIQRPAATVQSHSCMLQSPNFCAHVFCINVSKLVVIDIFLLNGIIYATCQLVRRYSLGL